MDFDLIENTRTYAKVQLYFEDFDEPEMVGLELEDSEIKYMKNNGSLYILNNEEEREISASNVGKQVREELRNFLLLNYIHPDMTELNAPVHFNILSSYESKDFQVFLGGQRVGNFKSQEQIAKVMGEYTISKKEELEPYVQLYTCIKPIG